MNNRLAIKMKEVMGKYGALLKFYSHFRNDNVFQDNISNFHLIFQHRDSLCPLDQDIERIINAYQKSRTDMTEPAKYDASNEWLPIYRKYLGTIIDALSRSDIQNVKKLYKNSFREELNNGLAGLPANMKKRYMGSKVAFIDKVWFIQDAVYRLRHLEALGHVK